MVFALPLALGVGLVMILIGIFMVIRSNQSQVTSLSQSSSIKSLAAAETGVSKVQSQLNLFREFATHPSACDGGIECWSQFKVRLQNREGCSTYADTDFPSELSNGLWIPIDVADPLKGYYRLDNYQFEKTTGRGTIMIEGADQILGGAPTGGVSRLTVDIPVIMAATPPPLLPNQDLNASVPSSCSYATLPDLPTPSDLLSTSTLISLTTPIDSNDTLPSLDIPGKQKYIYKFESLSPADNALDLDSGEVLTIRPANGLETTVVLMTDNNIVLNEGRIDIQAKANLIIISSKNINITQSAGAPTPPISNPSNKPLSLQFFLSGNDLDPENSGGDQGELNFTTQNPVPINLLPTGQMPPST